VHILRAAIEPCGAVCYHERYVTPKKTSKPSPKHRKATKKPAANKKPARPKAPKGKRPAPKPVRASAPELAPRPGEERARRESLAFAKAIIEAALDKKAIEPVLIDVCGQASYADFIGVVSGRSDRQVDAIAEGVCQAMADHGRRPLGREGARNGRWVLIDFGDVVLHVFYHPLREVFDIESLWIDAPRVKLQVPAEARADANGTGGSGPA
jgi:ribosome-associated protein